MLFYLLLILGNQGQTMSKARIGIVTVSDRASAGIYEDLSGKAIIDTLNVYLTSEWEPVYQVIPDEQDQIEATLIRLADQSVVLRVSEVARSRLASN